MTTTTTATTEHAAQRLLEELSKPDEHGYVTLNTVPYRAHHLLLTEALRLTDPGDVVFEGGVSSGYFAEAMAHAGRVVDGHELDPMAAEAARRVCRTVYEGDLQTFEAPEGTSYRLLLFGDTLEHIARPETVLTSLREHLEPGGHLVISVPNIANWSIRLQLLFGRFRYTDRGILDRTHVRFYTKAGVEEMLNAAGFTVVKLQAAVPVPGVTGERLAKLTHKLGNLLPGVFAYNFVVTATPR
ncbi:MAG: class I SAM-dependent methyltransferase [Acidimicrobiales bacterium]